MIPIVQLIQQRVLHHDGLKELEQAGDINPMTAFQNFAAEFATPLTAKDREIENPIHAINSNADDLIIVEDDGVETRYGAEKDEKNMKYDEYEATSDEKEDLDNKEIIELSE